MARTVDEIVVAYQFSMGVSGPLNEHDWLRDVLLSPIAPRQLSWWEWPLAWLFGSPQDHYLRDVSDIINVLKRRDLLTPHDEQLLEIFFRVGLADHWHWELLEQYAPRAAFVYSMRWNAHPYYCIGDVAPYHAVSDAGLVKPNKYHRLLHHTQIDMYLRLVDIGIATTDIVTSCYFDTTTAPAALIRAWHTLPNIYFVNRGSDAPPPPSPALTILWGLASRHGKHRLYFRTPEELQRDIEAQLVFALIVAVSDGLLRLSGDGIRQSFFRIAARLPLELQIELMCCVAPDVKIRAIGDAEILWLSA